MFCCVSHVDVIEPFIVFGISKSKIAIFGSETHTLDIVYSSDIAATNFLNFESLAHSRDSTAVEHSRASAPL